MRQGVRVFAGLFGALLLGVGVYALAFSPASPLWRYVGGTALVLLGIDALRGAFTGREPLIMRIGPLP